MDEFRRVELEVWLAPFLAALSHKTRARICPAHVAGLIGAGDRKSIQPMAARDPQVGYDQLHHHCRRDLGCCAVGRGLAGARRRDGWW